MFVCLLLVFILFSYCLLFSSCSLMGGLVACHEKPRQKTRVEIKGNCGWSCGWSYGWSCGWPCGGGGGLGSFVFTAPCFLSLVFLYLMSKTKRQVLKMRSSCVRSYGWSCGWLCGDGVAWAFLFSEWFLFFSAVFLSLLVFLFPRPSFSSL